MALYNKSLPVSLVAVSPTHNHAYTNTQTLPNTPRCAKVFTLNVGNEIPSQVLMFNNTFH